MISRALSSFLALTILAVLAPAAGAVTLDVPGKSNVFGAGHASPPGDGLLPPMVGITAAPGQRVTFSDVTGATDCCGSNPNSSPDGSGGGTDLTSVGGIAGIVDQNRRFYLVGVFLTDAEPVDPAPARLDFSDAAIGHDFASLSPEIGQVFFIGDGKTTGGSTQEFVVPANATRLALGLPDGNGFGGSPGSYNDNTGSISATFDVGTGGTPPPGGGGGGGDAGGGLVQLGPLGETLSVFLGSPRFSLPGGGNQPVRLLNGGQGIVVDTVGSCRLTLAERYVVRAAGAAGGKTKKKRKLGYLKKTSVLARGAGRWVVPLRLTKKGKKALKPKRKRARTAAGGFAAVRDPINVTCAPVQFPTVTLGVNTVINPVGQPQPVPGATPTTTPANPPLSPPPPAAPKFKTYSGKSDLGGGQTGRDTISFESDGKTIRSFTGNVTMSCATTGAGSGPIAGSSAYAIYGVTFPVANGGFGFTQTQPDYLTISGSIDATQAYLSVVVGKGFAGFGNATVVQCGARQQFRAKP